MKGKRFVSISVIGLAVCILLAACGEQSPATTVATEAPTSVQETEVQPAATEATQEPVTIRVGWTEAVDCFNPYGCKFIWRWGDLTYDMLIGKGSTPDCDGTPTRLLDQWDLSSDGMTWTLRLADNITFSDGTSLDAQGLADFLEWFSTTPGLQWFPTSWVFDSATVVDDHTIDLKVKSPSPDFARTDAKFWYMVSMDIWKDIPEDQIYSFEAYPPVGTGPYQLVEYEAGSKMIFEARPEYHRGKPPVDRIVVQFYGNNDAVANALLSGEIDITPPYMPPETADMLAADPNITLYEQQAARKYELVFNLAKEGKKHSAVDDPKVREAIDYAIDKQQLVDIVLLGHGKTCPTNWACAPNMPNQINPNLLVTPFDPERAKQILEEAGYTDSDGDGVRENENGLPLYLRLFYQTEESQQLAMAELVSDFLKVIGISIDIEALEKGQLWESGLETRDFDLIMMNNYTDVNAVAQWGYNYSCAAADLGSAQGNFASYCNQEVDQQMDTASHTASEADYQAALFSAQELLNNDRPFILLAGANKIQAYRSDRFEFPSWVCQEPENALLSYEGVMNTKPK